MREMQSQTCDSCFLDRTQLMRLKQKAMRRGVWFRALRQIDRALVELTIKLGRQIRSHTLAKSIISVTRKLEQVLENGYACAITEIGVPTARRLSLLAAKWGHQGAWKWTSDVDFIKYLAVTKLNEAESWNT